MGGQGGMMKKVFFAVMSVVGLALIVFLVMKTMQVREETAHVGRADVPQPTIAISGFGKVESVPNVATVQVGLVTEGREIVSVQAENTDKMNRLIAAMKAMGVAEKDIQTTNYSIYPKYDYTDGRSILSGYNVSQNVSVKVRDLAKVGDVFAKAGEIGANQVTGPDFTIDDPTALQAEAREKAIADAKAKAEVLARNLGMTLGRVVGFSEGASMPGPVVMYDRAYAEGMGGGSSPKVETGQLTISSDVSIIYEIK